MKVLGNRAIIWFKKFFENKCDASEFTIKYIFDLIEWDYRLADCCCCSCAFIAWYSPSLNPTLWASFMYFSAHPVTHLLSSSSKFLDRNPCKRSNVQVNMRMSYLNWSLTVDDVGLTLPQPVLTHFSKQFSTRKLYNLLYAIESNSNRHDVTRKFGYDKGCKAKTAGLLKWEEHDYLSDSFIWWSSMYLWNSAFWYSGTLSISWLWQIQTKVWHSPVESTSVINSRG